jgi:hypothetical protein
MRLRINSAALKRHGLKAAVASVAATIASNALVAHANVTASWTSETTDLWTNAADWSSSPNYPNNNTPPSTVYDAFINATGGTPYTVTLNSGVTLDALTIGSPDATLDVSYGGTLSPSTLNLSAGTLQLQGGGTIAGGTLNLSGGSLAFNNGTLSAVSVTGGDLQLQNGGSLTIENGITVADHNLDLLNGYGFTYLTFDGPSQTLNNLNINAAPNYYYYEPQMEISGPDSPGPVTLTLGASSNINGNLNISDGSQTGSTLINNGTIDATDYINISNSNFTNHAFAEATTGGTLVIGSPSWTNAPTGTISANASSLNFSGSWTNTGAVTATNNSTVDLEGNFATSALGNFTVDSTSTVNIEGTLSNTGSTLNTGTYGGNWALNEGTITGGTLNVSAGNFSVDDGTLNGVSVTGGDLQLQNGGSLTIENGITVADHNLDLLNGYSYTYLTFDGPSQTINNLKINAAPNYYYYEPQMYISGPDSTGPVTLTLGATSNINGNLNISDGPQSGSTLINNGTINATDYISINTSNFTNTGLTEATTGGTLVLNSNSWTSTGTISANASSLNFSGSWTNTGAVTATNNSTVDLEGNFATSALGNFTVDSTSTVNIEGTLSNTGSTLNTGTYGGNWALNEGTITGGTLNVSAGNFSVDDGTLNGVSVTGGDLQLQNGGSLTIENGITIADHNLDLLGNSNVLVFDGPSQAVNNLNINAGTGYSNQLDISGPDSGGPVTFTIGSSSSINGGFTINDGYQTGSTLINNGTINATGSLYINTTNFVNNNLIEATSGGRLYIDGTTNFTNTGALATHTGGFIDIPNSYTNTSSVLIDSGEIEFDSGFTQSGPGTTTITTGTLDVTGNLTISTGAINIGAGEILVDYTSGSDPIASIEAYIKSGFNGGHWNGPGIMSSNAQTPTNGRIYGVGWADGADGVVSGLTSGQIEIKYTLLGDANLDGTVNGSDFSILAANFGKGYTNWDQGNFLFTSSVNGSDFSALASNFGQGDSGADLPVTLADIAALDSFAIANGLPLPTFAAVPEPASALLIISTSVSILMRRRRKQCFGLPHLP